MKGAGVFAMSKEKPDTFYVRKELSRIGNGAAAKCERYRYTPKAEELAMIWDYLSSLAQCNKAIMDSFGIQDVTVRPAQIQRAGALQPDFIIEQHDKHGKIVKTVTLGLANLAIVEGADSGQN